MGIVEQDGPQACTWKFIILLANFDCRKRLITNPMVRKIIPLLLLLILAACGTKKRVAEAESRQVSVPATTNGEEESLPGEMEIEEELGASAPAAANTVEGIITTALRYSGVRYRYGGTNENGMDCSGLLFVAFKEHDIALPRVSHEMALEGRRVHVNEVDKGDLLFFRTTRRGGKINHVGLVVEVEGDDIKFIHSTSSRGVIVSSLREGFWNFSFVKATRVL